MTTTVENRDQPVLHDRITCVWKVALSTGGLSTGFHSRLSSALSCIYPQSLFTHRRSLFREL